MGVFVRAVVTGFGMSLGAAIFKKVQNRMGLEEEAKNQDDSTPPGDVIDADTDESPDESPGDPSSNPTT